MSRADYKRFLELATRWMDNDVYGHVNNVVYYSYFDTAVNHYLIDAGVLDVGASPVFGVVVETQCRFKASLSFPEQIDAGVRVASIGRTSVRWEIGIFKRGADEPAAEGHFVQVYVDRTNRRPAPVPEAVRAALQPILVAPGTTAPAR